MTRGEVLHVLFAGVSVRTLGRSVVVSVHGSETVLTPADAARLGRVLVATAEAREK
jgi:hypothetical protein